MTTKENFIKRYNDVKADVIEAMDLALEKAIGNNALDLDKMAEYSLDFKYWLVNKLKVSKYDPD